MQNIKLFKLIHKVIGSFLLLGLLSTHTAHARSLETITPNIIATVDMQAIQKSQKIATITQQLQKQIAPQEAHIKQLKSEYEVAVGNFEKEAPVMEEKARKAAEIKIDQLKQTLQENALELQQNIVEAQTKLYAWVVDIIKGVAEELKVKVVMPKPSTQLLYSDPSLDITDQTIKAFNKSKNPSITLSSKTSRKSK